MDNCCQYGLHCLDHHLSTLIIQLEVCKDQDGVSFISVTPENLKQRQTHRTHPSCVLDQIIKTIDQPVPGSFEPHWPQQGPALSKSNEKHHSNAGCIAQGAWSTLSKAEERRMLPGTYNEARERQSSKEAAWVLSRRKKLGWNRRQITCSTEQNLLKAEDELGS